MAARGSAARRARGGDGISAQRTIRTRLITGAGALTALGVSVFVAVLAGGTYAALADGAAALALAAMTTALVLRRAGFASWSVVAAAVAYIVGREGAADIDGRAALVGASLLLASELAAWSIADDRRVHPDRAVVARRAATIGVLVAAAFVIDVLLLGLAALSTPAGLALAVAGVAAAVAAMGLVLRLARP